MAADQESETVAIKCPDCGQAGTLQWSRGSGSAPKAANRALTFVSRGFHVEKDRLSSGAPALVCDICDAILPLSEPG